MVIHTFSIVYISLSYTVRITKKRTPVTNLTTDTLYATYTENAYQWTTVERCTDLHCFTHTLFLILQLSLLFCQFWRWCSCVFQFIYLHIFCHQLLSQLFLLLLESAVLNHQFSCPTVRFMYLCGSIGYLTLEFVHVCLVCVVWACVVCMVWACAVCVHTRMHMQACIHMVIFYNFIITSNYIFLFIV